MSTTYPDLPSTSFPESLNEPVRMEDITIADLPLISQYNQLIANGDLTGANAFLEANPSLKPKIFSADNINESRDLSVAIARLFFSDIDTYFINAIKPKGAFDPLVKYTKFDIVVYGEFMYMGIVVDIPISTLPTTTEYYTKQTTDGATFVPTVSENGVITWTNNKSLPNPEPMSVKGNDGVGLRFGGEYSASKTYAKDDGVSYGGIFFASLADGNLNNIPDLAMETLYWSRALDVTITVTELIGTRNLVIGAGNVNFMTGEIVAFNPAVDSLAVYKNSIRLTKDVDYTINANNQSIDKIEEIWYGTPENPVFFEFVVIKNVLNNLVFSDGTSIQDGTVAKEKFAIAVQTALNETEAHINDATKHVSADFKEIPIDTDSLTLVDSVEGNKVKKLTWANLKKFLAPLTHKSRHAIGGEDPLAPADIGAATIAEAEDAYDKAVEVEEESFQSLQGFIPKTTTFTPTTITETMGDITKTTTFNPDGSITETMGNITKITTFNSNGSITEGVTYS